MKSSTTTVWLLPAGILLMTFLCCGCSAFHGSRAMDMAPFAENTSLMFAEAAKVSRPFRAVYLRPYANIPEVGAMQRQARPLIAGLRGLVLYSNQVVALNMSNKSDREKNRLLAEYLGEATGSVAKREKLESLGITAAGLDSILASVRSAETFLKGIDAASSLVNVIVVALLDGFEEINDQLPALMNAFDAAIEKSYKEKRAAYEGLTRLQARYMIAATWLYESKSGNPTALDSLFSTDPSMRTFIPSPSQATPEQLESAEKELMTRLERISSLIEQLRDARARYQATQEELTDLRIDLEQRIKVARDAVIVWGQSHRNLGAGIPVPPLVNLSKIASGVVGAVPLP